MNVRGKRLRFEDVESCKTSEGCVEAQVFRQHGRLTLRCVRTRYALVPLVNGEMDLLGSAIVAGDNRRRKQSNVVGMVVKDIKQESGHHVDADNENCNDLPGAEFHGK